MRVSLLMRSAKLVTDKVDIPCIIRDASASGVKVRLFHPLPHFTDLKLETAAGDRYPVELVWSADDHAGLRFVQGVDVRWLIDDRPGPYPKRPLRFRCALKANIHADGDALPVIIHNISQKGAHIECAQRLALNGLVRIEASDLPDIFAKVRWRRQPHYGLVFEQTFRLEDLARLLVARGRTG